jgi:predicted nucleotidyltransferase
MSGSLPADLPDPVSEWLLRATRQLIEGFAEDLEAVVLFGSAADGRMRASSDVNLLVVLRRVNPQAFDAISELIQGAAAAIQLHPMFVLSSELPLAIDAFAVKFEDIARRRVVLYGEDPFKTLVIPRAQLVSRIQQTLLNLTVRLRATYVINRQREDVLAMAIADAAAPLRRSAHAIMELRGVANSSPKESLQSLAAELGGGWTEDLRNLSRARDELQLPSGTAALLVLRLARLSEAMQQPTAQLQR